MCYKREVNILNFIIKIEIKLENEFNKLAIEIPYNNLNSKTGVYKKYVGYYNRNLITYK